MPLTDEDPLANRSQSSVANPEKSPAPESDRYGANTDRRQRAEQALRPTTRTRRTKRIKVLALTSDPRISRIVDELHSGQGVAAYELICISHTANATDLLRDAAWDAFVLDERSFATLSMLGEAERLRVLRAAVVITEPGMVGATAIGAAESLPAERLSRFSLDNILSRFARHRVSPGKTKDRETLQDILWGIARHNLVAHSDITSALKHLVETAARLLRLGRASVWQIVDGPKRLRCLAMFDAATGELSSGIEVPATACPGYCTALENHRIMAIRDALSDPRSSELASIYLRAAGIGALLDAPIYLDGEVVGLFCCAHSGGTREWSEAEQYLAASFSDYTQLVLMAQRRKLAEDQVNAQRVRMQQGQRLELVGALADMAVGRFQQHFSTASLQAQQLVRDEAGHLNPAVHSGILHIMSQCEAGIAQAKQLLSFSASTSPAASPSTGNAAAVSQTPVTAQEACRTACTLLGWLNQRGVIIGTSLCTQATLVPGQYGDLQGAVFSLVFGCYHRVPNGGSLGITSRVISANGGMGGHFELILASPAPCPLHELEAGLVLASSFAAEAGGALEVSTPPAGGTQVVMRLPERVPERPLQAQTESEILIVADVEDESQSLVDMLRFFRHRTTVMGTHESIAYLRKRRSGIALVILDANCSPLPAFERLRAIRLATDRKILVVGSAAACIGLPADGMQSQVLLDQGMATIAAAVEQLLPREKASGHPTPLPLG